MRRTKNSVIASCGISLAVGLTPAVASELDTADETLVVTGSRVQEATPMGVFTLDREAIDQNGAVTLTGITRDLIYNSAGTVDEQFTQGFAPASASIDLRGMGANRTLVLLNGRRMPVFPFAMNGNESFVDLNLVPLAAIDRVEVLNGGSAIYGADAVGGVVNIITRDASAARSVGGRFSTAAEGDGDQTYLSLAGGASLGEADFSLALDYLDRNPIMARDRDISASANGPIDDRSSAGNPGTFITSAGPVPDSACPPERLRGPFCSYDFAQDVTLVPRTKRLGLYGSWDQSLTDSMGVFAQVMYSDSESARDLAGAPNAYPVSADNPNNPFGEDVLAIYRLNELGPRRDAFETDSLNFTAGIEGALSGWNWQLAGGVADIDTTISGVSGYALAADVQAAIDSGVLNVFGDSPDLDAEALLYETERAGETRLKHAELRINGNLFDMHHGSAGAAFGLEYRDESFSDEFDPLSAAGDVIGVGGVSADGDRQVTAAYAEVVLPVLEDVELQVAGRYDDYSDFGGTFNPRLGVHWQAMPNLSFRAAASTGFKAPALHELYSGEIAAFDSVFDTTNCEAARAANDPDGIATFCDTVQEVMFIASGNPELDAEESEHLSLGGDWQILPAWNLSVDYWRVDNEQAVSASPQFYIDNEADNPGNVVRDGNGNITTVLSPFQNLASQKLWGVDMDTSYGFDFGPTGALRLDLMTAYLGGFEQRASIGEPSEDIAGQDGRPHWRAQAGLTWMRSEYSAGLKVHYTGGYDRVAADDEVGSWTTVDMRFDWAPTMLRGGSLAVGIDNALDKAPPEDAFLEGWPFFNRALHDPRGRFFYLGYSHRV